MNIKRVAEIAFPDFTGIRCLMMPFIQGEPESVPFSYRGSYSDVLSRLYFKKGDIGYLTIDESAGMMGEPHRGFRSQYGRALHTEAGRHPDKVYAWGGGGWGKSHRVTLSRDVGVLLASNIGESCALWDAEQAETSLDGDIGYLSNEYPYSDAVFLAAGEVYEIGILTPHESLPLKADTNRQFIRIVSSGVTGREAYFTQNPLVSNGGIAWE